jgi:hypothetical protein
MAPALQGQRQAERISAVARTDDARAAASGSPRSPCGMLALLPFAGNMMR